MYRKWGEKNIFDIVTDHGGNANCFIFNIIYTLKLATTWTLTGENYVVLTIITVNILNHQLGVYVIIRVYLRNCWTT